MEDEFEKSIRDKMREMRNSTGCSLSDQLNAISYVMKHMGN